MENLKMIGKTKILTGLATIAVVGSAAVPFVASAQQSGTPGTTAPATAPEHGGPRGGTALATALGITPEALKVAIEAARATTPKLTADQMKDKAAREANQTAYQAALATKLGITVEKLQTAQTSVRPAPGDRKGPGSHGPGELRAFGNEALAKALGIDIATLTAAEKAVRESLPKPAFTPGTRPDQPTLDALKAQHATALAAKLGISVDALNAAQAKVKAEFAAAHQARETQMLATVLAKAVTDGKITQAKADEIKAQVAQGGDAAKAARETLRTLLGGGDRPQRGPGGPGGRGFGGPAKAATPSA